MSWSWEKAALAARVVVGALFVYAGWLKLTDPVSFAAAVDNYRLISPPYTDIVAAWLPPLEVLCGASLVLGVFLRPAALVLGLLNLVFMAALVAAAARGLDIDCGCFGRSGIPTSPLQALARDVALMAGLLLAWRWPVAWRLRR